MRSIGPTQLGAGPSISSVEVPKRKVGGQKVSSNDARKYKQKHIYLLFNKTKETH